MCICEARTVKNFLKNQVPLLYSQWHRVCDRNRGRLRSICSTKEFLDDNWNLVDKKDVHNALKHHDKKEIVEKFGKYKKLDNITG